MNFDLVGFYTAHRHQLEALSNIVIGQLAPNSTAKFDCESLFSQAGALAQPNRANAKIETFERLITGKYCLARIYCDKKKVKTEFLCHWKDEDLRDNDDRNNLEFWRKEKEIFLDELPQHEGLFKGLELDGDDDKEDH